MPENFINPMYLGPLFGVRAEHPHCHTGTTAATRITEEGCSHPKWEAPCINLVGDHEKLPNCVFWIWFDQDRILPQEQLPLYHQQLQQVRLLVLCTKAGWSNPLAIQNHARAKWPIIIKFCNHTCDKGVSIEGYLTLSMLSLNYLLPYPIWSN